MSIFKKSHILLLVLCITVLWPGHNLWAVTDASIFSGPLKLLAYSANDTRQHKIITLKEVQDRLDKINALLSSGNAKLADPAKLKTLKNLYLNLVTLIKKQQALKKQLDSLERLYKSSQIIKPKSPPPYNLTFYDSLLDQLSALRQEIQSTHLEIKLTTSLIKETQEQYRSLLEQQSKGNSSIKNIDIEIVSTNLKIQKVRLQNLILSNNIINDRQAILKREILWVHKHLHFDKADLLKQIATIEAEKKELKLEINRLLARQKQEERIWRHSLEQEDQTNAVVAAQIKARQAWLKTTQLMLEQAEDTIRLLDEQESAWKRRYQLLQKQPPSVKELIAWKDQLKSSMAELTRVLNLQQNYQISLQARMALLDNQFQTQGINPKVKIQLQYLEAALRKRSQARINYISNLFKTLAVEQRLLSQINIRLRHSSLEHTFLLVKSSLEQVLNFSIWTLDNHPVTLKKLIVALIVLGLGIFLAKYMVSLLKRHLMNSTQLEETTISAIGKVTFYMAIMMVVLLALKIVHIPLEAFAFLGGAMAIGIGFGAQNLINNFISGFIMMAERPISIGDIIEIEGRAGIVEEIGARCTRICTAGNIRILVPNSSFLEKNITNWTLSDRQIRTNVTVGVAYGSPVRKVEQLLVEAVKQCERTIKVPDPFVVFSDFGDNALVFKVYFWISIRRILERQIIEGMVRVKIDELFNKEGIVIAFPQRDVHLDGLGPVEVRLTKDKPPSS